MFTYTAENPCDHAYMYCGHKDQQERPLGQRKNLAPQQTSFCDIPMLVILLLANVSIPCRYPTTKNLSDLDLISRSVNVKFDNAIGLAIYGFLLTVNSNI